MENKVKIKSLVTGGVTIIAPELRLRRTWEKKGAVKTIDFDVLEEAMYKPGIEYMFREGILGIEDMDVKIKLGLEPEGAVEPENIIVLDDAQRERYLKFLPLAEFKIKIQELPKEQVIELCNYAIENQLVDLKKDEILQKITGMDIVNTIRLNNAEVEAKEG